MTRVTSRMPWPPEGAAGDGAIIVDSGTIRVQAGQEVPLTCNGRTIGRVTVQDLDTIDGFLVVTTEVDEDIARAVQERMITAIRPGGPGMVAVTAPPAIELPDAGWHGYRPDWEDQP